MNARITVFRNNSRAHIPEDRGVVVVVYDGDTIKVRFKNNVERKIRLIGVDSPEIEEEREGIRFFAFMAKRFSFYHLFRKNVRLSYDWELEDKYGRLLAYVWCDNVLFNEFILREGFSSAFLKFPFGDEYRKRFIAAERAARINYKGLWQKEPLPSVSSSEAMQNTGKFIAVNFKCTEVRFRGRFVFLHSPDDFSVLIPSEKRSLFSDVRSFKGKRLSIKGFVEEYEGQPQIIVFLPLQIRMGTASVF